MWWLVHVVKKMFEASTYVYSHDYLFKISKNSEKFFGNLEELKKKNVNLEKLENF